MASLTTQTPIRLGYVNSMGSVLAYENAKGERLYRILYRKPDHKQTQERGFRRKKDAELRLAELELGKAKGEFVNPSDARETFESVAVSWLKSQQGVMKPSSYRVLESSWETHVRKKWGSRQLGGIRHSELQAWVSNLSAEKSATTVLRAHGVVAAVLDVAVKDRRIARNVARGLALPRKKKKSRAYLTHQQVDMLAKQATYPDVVLFLAYTGLRWGEVTGIRVKSLDSVKRRVSVEENAVMVGGQVIVGTPKTHETRQVPYPEFLDDGIAATSAVKHREALVFGDGLTHLRLPNSERGWFRGAVDRCQAADPTFPKVTPHDLRHTAASLAISAGANVKAVQRMLGHASAAMTLDTYSDLFDDDLDDVATALNFARSAEVVAKVLPDAGQ